MVATGMPLSFAVGRSLVAVTAFGAATATSYAYSGLVDWQIAALFTGGGFLGGLVGLRIGRLFAQRKQLLGTIFAFFVIWVGLYVLARGIAAANLLQRILS